MHGRTAYCDVHEHDPAAETSMPAVHTPTFQACPLQVRLVAVPVRRALHSVFAIVPVQVIVDHLVSEMQAAMEELKEMEQ